MSPTQENATQTEDTQQPQPSSPGDFQQDEIGTTITQVQAEMESPANWLPNQLRETLRGTLRERHRWSRFLSYIALGIVSFIFFLYVTFPYAVLKEFVVTTVSSQLASLGLNSRVNIASLRPSWITGIEIDDFELINTTDARAKTKFEEVRARLNVLPLFIGNFTLSTFIRQQTGTLESKVTIPFSSLFGEPSQIPFSHAHVEFKSFKIDSFVNHGLATVGGDTLTGPWSAFLKPLLVGTSLGGKLTGAVNLGKSDLDSLTGKADLAFDDLFLVLDEGLQISRQDFKEATFHFDFNQTSVTIRKPTKMESKELKLDVSGQVDWKTPPVHLDLKFAFSSRGQLYEKIGSLLLTFMRCPAANAIELPGGDGKEYHLEASVSGGIGDQKCQ